jgi:chromate transporter
LYKEIENKVLLVDIFTVFLKLGVRSFGGPAMIAHIRELAVEKKKWLSDTTFKNGVAFCQMIPGASAMQTAAYVGLKMRGTAGAAMSFIGFGLPAFILMMIFSILYQKYHDFTKVISIFTGLQAILYLKKNKI